MPVSKGKMTIMDRIKGSSKIPIFAMSDLRSHLMFSLNLSVPDFVKRFLVSYTKFLRHAQCVR